jgi:hypothetical protein
MPTDRSLFEFFATQAAQIPLLEFLVNLLLSALLAFLLSRVYVRFGHALSNRDLFGRNFVVIAMTTMVIITIVKSSLALSLGLVGALSIIRFRAAIKEPEELSYLFLAISIGLGFGASQTLITLIAFAVIVGILALKHYVRRVEPQPNFYLTVTTQPPHKVGLQEILQAIQQHSSAAVLKRFDETPHVLEASFQVRFPSVSQLDECNGRLKALGDGVKVSCLEERGIGA